MENKTAKVLLVLALGTVVVYIIFKTTQASAAELPKVLVIPAEPKEPKWYTTTQKAIDIFKQLGGLFKREDQVVKDALETTTATQ